MMPLALSRRIRRALVLATGQITSYGSGAGVDDGGLEIGELHRYTVLTTGQYSGTVNITLNGKTDVHSNACVMDDATGLMWSRSLSASVGTSGLLPFTTNGSGEGIFAYAAAANTAGLAGYSDWRIPNLFELFGLCDFEAPTSYPNATAFPTWSTNAIYSSTTGPSLTTGAMFILFASGLVSRQDKALTGMVILVRGPL